MWINAALALVLIVAAVGTYLWLFAPRPAATSSGWTVAVQKGTVSRTITATGSVNTAGLVKLAFLGSGKVETLDVSPGDHVRAGQVLATTESATARQALAAARSAYVQAVAGVGRTQQSIGAAQSAVEDARTAVTLNRAGYDQAVATAKTALADARSSWSASCVDPTGSCPDTDAWAQLRAAEEEVNSAKTAYDQAVQTATADEVTQKIAVAQAAASIRDAQSQAASDCATYGSGTSMCTASQRALTSAQQAYETAANAQQVAAINAQQRLVSADQRVTVANVALRRLQGGLAKTAAKSVVAAEQALRAAELVREKGIASDREAVRKAEENLAALRAADASVTTSAGSMSADQAAIAAAKAGVDQARQALDFTRLKAPIGGTVVAVSNRAGDVVSAGATVMAIAPKAPFEVVANVSEADATSLAVGQSAAVTFDALGQVASGTVTRIDLLPVNAMPSSPANNGPGTGATTSAVTSYRATITLTDAPANVKQGMSASVVVTTQEVADVLWVPTAAVTTADGRSTVTVRADGVDSTVVVQTGLQGDSAIQITSGLAEGQQIVIDTGTTPDDTNELIYGPEGGF